MSVNSSSFVNIGSEIRSKAFIIKFSTTELLEVP